MATLSTLTMARLEQNVRDATGANDPQRPNSDTIRRWANVIAKKIAMLTLGVDAPWGRNDVTLSLLQAVGIIYNPGGGSTAYTASTNTFSDTPTVDATYVGGIVFWEDRANSRAFWGLIDEVPSTTSFVVRVLKGTGAEADVASGNLLMIAKPNPWFYNGANLTSVNYMDIVKVVDGTNGLTVRTDIDGFSGLNPPSISTQVANQNWLSSVVVSPQGDAVYIGKGSSVSAFGTLTMTFEERPDNLTSSTSTVDILPEHVGVLREELSRWVYNYLNEGEKAKAMGYPLQELEAKFREAAKSRLARKLKLDKNVRG